ncbi:hypothetical protein M011DRAFT_464729 [Sporormia fimetaria CBS 119925]|uniref:Yeast cell wall synthesis Kre9/Knh1-like N-terminal domain-containing protein n=1 Tax=Sporormia fimetaria CBS 119925 TaxID=1340428 RepID=A0A6A6VNX3_9PLEO|nr:hypothetical protein M011DRAFT_464729 [Sporormia fimetaria CBS 119925]
MRFTQTLLAGAALLAAAWAVEINEYPTEVQAGRSYRVTYTPGDETPTTFILRQGDNDNLDTITTLTETATGGEFMWNVDSALPNGADYALEIRQGTEVNYIGPIALSGGAASSAALSSTTEESSTATDMSMTTSVSAMPTNSANTTETVSVSRTPTRSASPTETESEGAPEATGAASALGASPLALVLGAVAAFAYLN